MWNLGIFWSALAVTVHCAPSPSRPTDYPICDVNIDSAICLHDDEKVLLPDARPYGLVLHLDFNSTQALDTSGYRNHGSGTLFAAPDPFGVGASAMFRQSYIMVPHTDAFETGDFSITFFLYLLRDSQSQRVNAEHDEYCPLIHKGTMSEQVAEAAPAILLDPKTLKLKVVVSTTASATSPGEFLLSEFRLSYLQWHHVAVVRQVNTLRLYLDGVLDSELQTSGLTRTSSLPLHIGSAPYATSHCDVPILIDELRFYAIAQGRDHIQAEAAAVLGIEPSYVHIGCKNCSQTAAEVSCPDLFHLCTRLELYNGVFQLMKRIGIADSDVIQAGATRGAEKPGIGICCANI